MSVNINVGGVQVPFPSNGDVDTAAEQLAFARAVAAEASLNSGAPACFSAASCPADTATNFLRPYGSTVNANTTEVKIRVFACTISKLYIQAATGPSGDGIAITVRKNGVATALTATLAIAVTQAEDTTHSVTFADGDTLSVSCIGGASISGVATQVYATMKLTEV